ncbi:MAG: NACHT domain-containing protein [Caldilineaceae bacterium]
MEKRYGQLDMRGIERRERRVLSLTLDDVYVSLAVAVQPDRKQRRRRAPDAEAANEPRLLDMRELLGVSPRLVVIGGPGSGKTTYLQIIAADLARALRTGDTATLSRHLGMGDALPLPVFVSLSEFNRYRMQFADSAEPRHGTLTDFISHALIRQESAVDLPPDFFARLLTQGRACILLLDGLDEVADDRERQLVRAAVQRLAANGGVGHMLVASRTRAYREEAVLPEEFRVAEVQPMSSEQVNTLAARWCAAAYNAWEADAETARLQQAIDDLERVRTARGQDRLIDSPLLVTIVAIVHYNERRLPEQRAELYEKCVEVLLTEKHHHESDATFELADWGGSLAQKRSLLADLAARMMSAGEAAGRSVDEDQLRAWLRPRLVQQRGADQADAELDTFVRAMRERGSLLDERDGIYQFIHLTFQEFLAAFYLAETVRDADRIVAFGGR